VTAAVALAGGYRRCFQWTSPTGTKQQHRSTSCCTCKPAAAAAAARRHGGGSTFVRESTDCQGVNAAGSDTLCPTRGGVAGTVCDCRRVGASTAGAQTGERQHDSEAAVHRKVVWPPRATALLWDALCGPAEVDALQWVSSAAL
jgi:hypothetical protein